MKILLESDSFIYQTSGVANVVIALADGLRQRGNEVKVLALSNDLHSRREGDNYFIRSAKSILYPDVRIDFVNHHPLLTELKEWKPDLIHLHTEGSVARMAYHLADATGAPLVMTTHTDYAHFIFGRYRSGRPVQKLMTGWGKLVYRRAARVIAPSEKAKRFIQLKSVRDRTVVIPNGIPLEHYQKPVSAQEKAEMFRKTGFEDHGNTLVMVTRLSREKNIAEILQYMPALLEENPKAQLILVGDGPDRERLTEITRQEGLEEHVRFTGRIPPEEVYRYYAMGDVFVSASTFEVHSLSYLEAMACGLPLVCREDDSLLGVLEDGGNGRIYRTEEEYVEAVNGILQSDETRERMRKNALEKIREFSEERFVEKTCALYESVLEGAGSTLSGG